LKNTSRGKTDAEQLSWHYLAAFTVKDLTAFARTMTDHFILKDPVVKYDAGNTLSQAERKAIFDSRPTLDFQVMHVNQEDKKTTVEFVFSLDSTQNTPKE